MTSHIIKQIRIYFGPLLSWTIVLLILLFLFYKSKIFLSAWLAAFFAQLLKMVITSLKLKRFSPMTFFRISGMPSAHTATMTALVTAIFLKEGVTTTFILAFFAGLIMIHFLLASRHRIIPQQEALSILLTRLEKKKTELKDEWGHTGDEIAFGAILGIITAIVVYIL